MNVVVAPKNKLHKYLSRRVFEDVLMTVLYS